MSFKLLLLEKYEVPVSLRSVIIFCISVLCSNSVFSFKAIWLPESPSSPT